MCKETDYDNLHLCYLHRDTMHQELAMWHQHYLPLNSKVCVLDGGAGCGETAFFFLQHGFSKVVAIESDPLCFDNLKYNFRDDGRVVPIHAKLDFLKFDVEGAEKSMVMEIHFPFKITRLESSSDKRVSLIRLEEHWGSRFAKLRRKVGRIILP